ncbi:MAG: NUDIX hydrolase [Pseudonocardiaceae bacterium]
MPNPVDLTRQDDAAGVAQQVVGAIIDHNGQILLLRRPVDDFRGGTWELPSGKVEAGEDLTTALHREVTEETGLHITEIMNYLGAFDYTSGSGKHTRQHTWAVTVGGTQGLRLSEHDHYMWTGAGGNYAVSDEVNALIEIHFSQTHA